MPASDSFGHTYLFFSPVSNNPNPAKDRSPIQKSRMHKYLSHKVHSETRVCDKVDRPKKHRLSLDRFVPRSKPKINEKGMELRKKSFSPTAGRRLSNTSNSSDVKKRRRSQSVSLAFTPPQVKMRNTIADRAFEDIFMDAEVNLSDDCSEQVSQNGTNDESNPRCKRVSSIRKPTHSYALRNSSSPNVSTIECDTVDVKSEEYVKIPKSEYEEIKNRVSAIESRISQEFKSITSDSSDVLTVNPIIKVQNEYEKTLVEANIENTSNADQLAKRLSRELKIRKSAEHKIIRSPSARKIGILRRRSQENNPICNRKVQRTASWHVSDRSHIRNNSIHMHNYYPKQCNLKRGRPLVKRDSNKSLNQTPKTPEVEQPTTFCSEETNARLKYLQEQLNTLISHTAEHTRGAFSDDDFEPLEDDVFQHVSEPPPTSTKLTDNTSVRRSSSFHTGDFIDNSRYFNNKIKELKQTNSQVNLLSDSECSRSATKSVELKKEKTVSWKDADDYFQQETKMRTPVTQTGRASVAKLRTQNAGMVLAKAKLFDDPTKEAVDVSRRQSMKISASARPTSKQDSRSPHGNKRYNNNDVVRRRQNVARRSPNVSPLIKMEVTISGNGRRRSTRFNTPRTSHEDANSVQKENQLIQSVTSNDNSMTNRTYDNVNIYNPDESPMCKTPHIKRPLNVKTPRSAKSLSSRRVSMHPRRTPLKAVLPITPKRQSPRIVLKSTQLTRHMN